LSDTFLIGEYLKMSQIINKENKRDEHIKQSLVLQHQINEKQETLRHRRT
jgi:hypothetical protein